jgi:hypothetical protein
MSPETDDQRETTWRIWRRPEVRRRVLSVAQHILAAPFVAYGVLLPAALAILVTDWAFGTHLLALELPIVVALMALTVRVVWWIAGGAVKSELRFGRFGPALRATALAGFAAVSFTSLTALLYQHALVGISPAPSDDRVLDVTFSFYLWHMANTVPLVDIPGNLGWQKPLELHGGLGGLLVIGFTGFVIFPLIQFARLVLAGGEAPFEVKVVRALGKHVGDDRISIVRKPDGYGQALVDECVVIAVMQDVRNHDAAVQHIQRLGAKPFEHRARGYLLVVDAVAEGARERIEHSCSEAPFEAALVVWRADQRPADLTAALDLLQERMGVAAPALSALQPALAA